MGIALSTAGVEVGYALGTLASRPTTGYKEIPDIKSTPDFNVDPNGIDVTNLKEKVAKQYVEGLRDYGSTVQFGANLTKSVIKVWEQDICDVALASNSETPVCWIQIAHPSLDKGVFIPTQPVRMGLPSMEVDSALETTLYAMPLAGADWQDKVDIADDTTE